MVNRSQRGDDPSRFSRSRRAQGDRNRSDCFCRLPARFYRCSTPSLCLAQAKQWRLLWKFLLGIVYILVGGCLLVNLTAGLASLTLALAMYLLAEGVLELILSFRLWPMLGSGWLLFDGILTLIFAVMIWKAPADTHHFIGTSRRSESLQHDFGHLMSKPI